MATSKIEPEDVFWDIAVTWERLTSLVLLLEVKDHLMAGYLHCTWTSETCTVSGSDKPSGLPLSFSWLGSHSPTSLTFGMMHVSQKQDWVK